MNLFDIRTEGMIRPLGLATDRPRFSWKFHEAPPNFLQKGCQIQVAHDGAFEHLMWDSGLIAETDSHLVPYGGPGLSPGVRYWVRVRVDSPAGLSPWSGPDWFERALDQWKTPFIAAEPPKSGKSSAVRSLRKRFAVPFEPKSARLYATALGVYQALVNERETSDAILTPGWSAYHHRLLFQTYDITHLVVRGDNEVKCLVAPGWFKGSLGWTGQRNLYGAQMGLSARLVVEGDEGQRLEVETDDTWEMAGSGWLSAELYHGETYDARLEATEKWVPAPVMAAPKAMVVPQDGPLVRPQERLGGQTRITKSGRTLIDFGQNCSGVVSFQARGPAGARIVLKHGELLDRQGELYTKNLRSARQTVDYTLRGGVERFAARFCTMGFRYVVVEAGEEFLDLDLVEAVVYHSEMEPTIEFACSHEGVTRLHENILWGWRGNAVEVPTDCPQRDERLGWTGDAQVFAATASRLTRSDRFFRKWLADLRAEQRPDGGVPLVIPDVLSRFRQPKDAPVMGPPHTACGWGDAAVIVPWEVYRASGDIRVLEESFRSMRAWVDRVREISTGGLLWNTWPQLGDWLALDAKEGSFFGATPSDLVATAYYARSVELVAQTAKVLGYTTLEKRYRNLHTRIVKAFQGEFITPHGRMAANTQTALALGLAFDLIPERHRARTIDDLATLLKNTDGHLTTGFLGTPVLCDALTEGGRLDLAYALLLKADFPSWLYQVSQGATTVWEHWDGLKPDGSLWNEKMNSFNHYAYGAIGDWMYRTIGGITLDPKIPGYQKVRFEPRPGGGITWSRHSVETPRGRVSLSWRLTEGQIQLSMTVPPNGSAELVLPGLTKSYGSGTWTEELPWTP